MELADVGEKFLKDDNASRILNRNLKEEKLLQFLIWC